LTGGAGDISFRFKATGTTSYLGVLAFGSAGTASDYATFDNISVREINPLSVSIQMDGRMTYADEDLRTSNPMFARWYADANNLIYLKNNTFGASITGRVDFQQVYAGTTDVVVSGITEYAPGVLVPYNIASRHGSTFLNGAVDGTALTEDTTPVALPDLSATDLELGYEYMGTIGTFRVWDQDLGDDGIVTATAPSLEPSLSLTFDGSGLSFTVLDWSE
jgi:hypothetical protein